MKCIFLSGGSCPVWAFLLIGALANAAMAQDAGVQSAGNLSPAAPAALDAWDEGCAAIGSYDVLVLAEEKGLLNSDGVAPRATPLITRYKSRQAFQRGRWRIETLPIQNDSQYWISIWDGELFKAYSPTSKELSVDEYRQLPSQNGPPYEAWYRTVGSSMSLADILRQRPLTKVEKLTDDTCVLYTPPVVGRFEYSPFGFRVTLDRTKNSMPVRVEYVLDEASEVVVYLQVDLTLELVRAGVWVPTQYVGAVFRRVDGTARKAVETTARLDREHSQFNVEIPNEAFELDVPEGTRVSDMIAQKSYHFGKADGVGRKLSQAVLRGERPVSDLKRYGRGPFQFAGGKPPKLMTADARGIAKDVTLEDFRGKWLLLEFWGPACGTCIHTALPDLVKFYKRHAADRDRFEVLSICSLQGSPDTIERYEREMAPVVKRLWNGQQLPFPILLDDDGQTFEAYCLHVLPTTLLIDPEGNVVENGNLKMLSEKLGQAKP